MGRVVALNTPEIAPVSQFKMHLLNVVLTPIQFVKSGFDARRCIVRMLSAERRLRSAAPNRNATFLRGRISVVGRLGSWSGLIYSLPIVLFTMLPDQSDFLKGINELIYASGDFGEGTLTAISRKNCTSDFFVCALSI
jgi:hypothetical protein